MDCSYCNERILEHLSFCKTDHAVKDGVKSLSIERLKEWKKLIELELGYRKEASAFMDGI